MKLTRYFFISFIFLFLCLELFATQDKKLTINNRITIDVEIADSVWKQMKGLGGRKFLSANAGMVFPYDSKKERLFWMKNMLIAIDIIWIADRRIVLIEHNVLPPKSKKEKLKVYGHGVLADFILEVNAGFAKRHGIKIDDQITLIDQ